MYSCSRFYIFTSLQERINRANFFHFSGAKNTNVVGTPKGNTVECCAIKSCIAKLDEIYEYAFLI